MDRDGYRGKDGIVRRHLICALAAVALAAAALAAPVAVAGGTATRPPRLTTHRLLPARPSHLPTRAGTALSLNWSGYGVVPPNGARVTGVSGAFVVPGLRSAIPPGYGATWVGIGGYLTGDLIQAGVGEDAPVGVGQYYAWFELLPGYEQQIAGCVRAPTCRVGPGDRVQVAIRWTGSSRWAITITDTHHWSWSRTVSYASSGSSAEWIMEAPERVYASTVPVLTTLPDLGVVRFDPTERFTLSTGGTWNLGRGQPVTFVLALEATPSTLDRDGDGFDVCAYQQRCPPPSS